MVEKLSELVVEAEEKCNTGRVYNLFLEAICNIEEIVSPFAILHSEEATLWQSHPKPEILIINHGDYIHRHGDGIKHLIKELKNKPDSNRALLSLIDLEDIIRSGDNPIPSFLILQFGFSSSDKKTLYCSAYFRALEVSKFLPINIAEICLITKMIQDSFLEIEKLNLTIHAFTAYSNPDFSCLKMSDMDLESNRGKITVFLINKNSAEIVKFLNSKLQIASYVFTDGMTELYNALKMCPEMSSPEIISIVKVALKKMKELKTIREKSSHSKAVLKLQEEIRESIDLAKDYFVSKG